MSKGSTRIRRSDAANVGIDTSNAIREIETICLWNRLFNFVGFLNGVQKATKSPRHIDR